MSPTQHAAWVIWTSAVTDAAVEQGFTARDLFNLLKRGNGTAGFAAGIDPVEFVALGPCA